MKFNVHTQYSSAVESSRLTDGGEEVGRTVVEARRPFQLPELLCVPVDELREGVPVGLFESLYPAYIVGFKFVVVVVGM